MRMYMHARINRMINKGSFRKSSALIVLLCMQNDYKCHHHHRRPPGCILETNFEMSNIYIQDNDSPLPAMMLALAPIALHHQHSESGRTSGSSAGATSYKDYFIHSTVHDDDDESPTPNRHLKP